MRIVYGGGHLLPSSRSDATEFPLHMDPDKITLNGWVVKKKAKKKKRKIET